MELQFIEKIKQYCNSHNRGKLKNYIAKSIGDDCAEIIPTANEHIIVTTDTFLENVHFRLEYFSPFHLGKKLASVNLSDIAAMGGRPVGGLLNLEIPNNLWEKETFWKEFFKGLCSRLFEFGAILLGGDTVSAPTNSLGLSLTLIGTVKKNKAIYRSGARQGDLIYTSGFLGEASCGLYLLENKNLVKKLGLPRQILKQLIHKHLDPTPRIKLGLLLSELSVNSLIDVSDGISTDLAHICQESGVGAQLFLKDIPISRSTKLLARYTNKSHYDFALYGGEDFELIWTIEPARAKEMETQIVRLLNKRPFKIGKITKGNSLYAIYPNGQKKEISFKGYEH